MTLHSVKFYLLFVFKPQDVSGTTGIARLQIQLLIHKAEYRVDLFLSHRSSVNASPSFTRDWYVTCDVNEW
jgi:hypothetical protein